MAWKLPRFRVRTLLLAIALFSAVLGLGIWWFTPRMRLSIIQGNSPGPIKEVFESDISITDFDRLQLGARYESRADQLYIRVTDSKGRGVIGIMGPPRQSIDLGRSILLSDDGRLRRIKPGVYHVEARCRYAWGEGRSNRVTVRVLPAPTPTTGPRP